MFERFTERARQVVVFATEEASTLGHQYIGSEHILLGLLREQEGLAARVLESLDITVERVRTQVVRIVAAGEEVTSGQIPFTPRATKVLELALGEAAGLGHNYVATEHILLGLVRENDGVAVRILLDFDADAEKIRRETLRLLDNRPPRPEERVQGAAGLPIVVDASPRVRALLLDAAQHALAARRAEIEPFDLLYALAGEASVAALLGELGTQEAALLEAIERRGGADAAD